MKPHPTEKNGLSWLKELEWHVHKYLVLLHMDIAYGRWEAPTPLGFMDCLPDELWENLTLVLKPEPVERKMGEERIEWVSLQKKVSLLLGVLVHAFNPNT